MKESKYFDWTVMNPITFLALFILEHASKGNPSNQEFKVILLRTYAKLGCTSKVLELSESFKSTEMKRILSKYLFSFYSTLGLDKQLEKHINMYTSFNETLRKTSND